jgi:tRNA G18 (ribose-2'-O)-methylase SpoU
MILRELASLKENPNFLVVDSKKVVQKFVLYSKFKPIEVFVEKSILHECDFLTLFPKVHELSSDDFQNIPGSKYHKGVIGVFERNIEYHHQLEAPFVILNGVTSPENVGSIVRTLSGLNFKTLVIDKKTVSPFVRRAIRVSMGNIVFINVLEVPHLRDFTEECPYPIYASGNEKGSIPLTAWEPERHSGFIIGSEGHGIDPELYASCKSIIRIPVREEVQHYNAGHSCAILASRYLFNTSE